MTSRVSVVDRNDKRLLALLPVVPVSKACNATPLLSGLKSVADTYAGARKGKQEGMIAGERVWGKEGPGSERGKCCKSLSLQSLHVCTHTRLAQLYGLSYAPKSCAGLLS